MIWSDSVENKQTVNQINVIYVTLLPLSLYNRQQVPMLCSVKVTLF